MNYSRGNILFIILIAIALFGALSFAVSQSKTGTAKNMSGEKLTIKVDQLLEYAQNVRSAVNFIYTHNNISESDIRFAHPDLDAAYGDYTALNSEQMVFDPSGGGIDYKPLPTGVSFDPNWPHWMFFAYSKGPRVGTDLADLMAVTQVTQEACEAINRHIGFSTPIIPIDTDSDSRCVRPGNSEFFSGTFNDAAANEMDDTDFSVLPAYRACVQCATNGNYYFYEVLLER